MRLPLHRKLFVTVGVGAAGLALVMSLLVDLTVVDQVNKHEKEELHQTQAAFEALQAYRGSQLLERCRLVSDLPYFKAAAAVYDPTVPPEQQAEAMATVSDVARRILQRVDVDLLVLTGTNGTPLLGVGPAVEHGLNDLTQLGSIARAAVRQDQAEGTLSLASGLISVTAVPVEVGGLQLGALCLGTSLDAKLAASLEDMTGSAVALLGERQVIARSNGLGPGVESTLFQVWKDLPNRNREDENMSIVTLNGTDYRTLWMPLQGPEGKLLGSFVVLRSADQALSFLANVRRGLMGIAFTAILVGLVFSYMFARQITIPIHKLVAYTQRVAKGDLEGRVFLGTGDELAELGKSFNRMSNSLAQSRRHQEDSKRALEERTTEIEAANRELTESKEKIEATHAALAEAHGQVIQAGKMAAFGELGAGIAHELRQPLSTIRGFAQLVSRKLPDDAEDSRRHLDLVVNSVDHMTKIVQGLKDFARKADFDFKQVDINEVIEKTCLLMKTQIETQTTNLTVEVDSGVGTIRGDANQLQQVLTNLIANARDGIDGDDGEIRVKTRSVGKGSYVMVTVTDNGRGIPADVLPKIFTSFFTTKAEGKGTGLGLSITQGIIHDHGGRIDVSSGDGETVFRIFLPTEDAKACWEIIDCVQDCRPEISGMEECAAYRENRGHRCWETLRQAGRRDHNISLPDCEPCPVYMAKTSMFAVSEEPLEQKKKVA